MDDATQRNTELRLQLEATRELAQLKDVTIDDLREDRNEWREQARSTARLLTDQREAAQKQPGKAPTAMNLTWWERVTGKTKPAS